jgi:hypothetical protein
MCDDGNDQRGLDMERAAFAEIARSGLDGIVAARYLPSRCVLRLGRPGPDGVPLGGIDYPIAVGIGTIRDHLRMYKKLKDAWE